MTLKRHYLNAACLMLLACSIATPAQDPAPSRRRAPRAPQTATNQPPPAVAMKVAAPQVVDSTDPAYGSKIRQLRKDDGHEHNFYYYRDPWNADGSRMLGIQSDLNQKNWHVVLYDGDGKFLKDLFPISQYDWRLCWDRKDPDILYTWRGYNLHRFNVNTGEAKLLKSFEPLPISTAGPSVNQTGDRLVVSTSDHTFHSYRLPDLGDERAFKPEIPPGCFVSWDKPRYTGWRNTIDVAYKSPDLKQTGILLYDDTGALVHHFKGIGGGGHYAFSCDGRLAYFFMPRYPRSDGKDSLDIHVVDADGSNDRVLYSASRAQAAYVQNLHVSWPSRVGDWFVASFFHFPNMQQPAYAPPYDEILQIRLDGKTKFLARTGVNYSRGAGRGSSTDLFWAMPLAAPQADGKRICFNSNRSGTIDQHILYVEVGGKQ